MWKLYQGAGMKSGEKQQEPINVSAISCDQTTYVEAVGFARHSCIEDTWLRLSSHHEPGV